MAVGERRSRADLAEGFRTWVAERRPGWVDPQVEVSRPGSGLSSETVFVDVTVRDALHRLVARLRPTEALLFPDYSLARQYAVQVALADASLPVPRPLTLEPDPRFVGSEFLLMPRLPGRTLETAYVTRGWLHGSSPARQSAVIRASLRTLATVHRLPVGELALGALSGGGPGLGSSLDYWDDYLTWATPDVDGVRPYREALSWCRSHLPEPQPTSLLWGDPQLANVVFDEDGVPSAVLDWEMAAFGPAEIDLAWFLSLHEITVSIAGRDLPGFPPRAVAMEWFAADLGRPLDRLDWYDVYAHLRSGAIVMRISELMRQAGRPAGWTADMPQPALLRRLIGA